MESGHRGEEQHMAPMRLALLQFEVGGPVVEDEWTVPATAQYRYTGCR